MANTSATGGYLSPVVPTPPTQDQQLDRLLQAYFKGLTGIDGQYVRPRWQPTVPKQPEPNVDWVAFGVMETRSEDFPTIRHNGAGDGSDTLQRQQELRVLCSFYGPNSMQYADMARDGAYVQQNNETLKLAGLTLIESGPLRQAADFYNQQWIRRWDLSFRFRRMIVRTYPVLNILEVQGDIEADNGLTNPINVP